MLVHVEPDAPAAAEADGEICTVANDNDPGQVVISGHKAAIDRAVAMVKDHDIKRGVLLPVSAPFHCPLMQPAAEAMETALGKAAINAPLLPVYANVLAAPIADGEEIKARLVEQVTGRVRWRESVTAMWDAGVTDFVEVGGKVKLVMPDEAGAQHSWRFADNKNPSVETDGTNNPPAIAFTTPGADAPTAGTVGYTVNTRTLIFTVGDNDLKQATAHVFTVTNALTPSSIVGASNVVCTTQDAQDKDVDTTSSMATDDITAGTLATATFATATSK